MPAEGIDFSARQELLTDDELVRLATIMVDLGVKKIRLTGGEPFARSGIESIIKRLSLLPASIHITTNAALLNRYFDIIEACAIRSLNISIDSLDRERFMMITRRDIFQQVMDNIIESKRRDLPIKLNTVVMRGVNDDEIISFIDFGMSHNISVRFIEAMPFNEDDGNKTVFMSASEIAEHIQRTYPSLLKKHADGSASDTYSIGDYMLGIIPSYSRTLCASCNRIRLTPQGELLTCLYAQKGESLRDLIRSGTTDEHLRSTILQAVYKKKKSGHEEEKERGEEVFQSMTTIGG